jgi:predicted DNA-binding transcriptional regulator YafY
MVDLRGSFLSGIPAQKDYGTYREFIKAIHDAIQERKTLQLVYHPRDQAPTERKIDPYAVHLHNGTLYLIGYCRTRKDIRRFVVDRMQKIKLTESPSPRHLGFPWRVICATASACSVRS